VSKQKFQIGDEVWFYDQPFVIYETKVIDARDLLAEYHGADKTESWYYTLEAKDSLGNELKSGDSYIFARPAGRKELVKCLQEVVDSVQWMLDEKRAGR
jgi:uncharacterized Zn ribbon protein